MWFVSGLVMLYVPYPSLSPAQKRLARPRRSTGSSERAAPARRRTAAAGTVAGDARRHAGLARDGWDGTHTTLAASRGTILRPVEADYAGRVAGRFGHARDPARRTVSGTSGRWRAASIATARFGRLRLPSAGGTRALRVSKTGAVVNRPPARERFWNWLGSVPHWLYPTVLTKGQRAWRQVVLWVSGPCIAAAFAGIWIGILRDPHRRTALQGWADDALSRLDALASCRGAGRRSYS